MADWEEEDFEPAPPGVKTNLPKGQWDDEDVEENDDVKESWEDEEETTPATKPEPPPEKTEPKPASKGAGKAGKVQEAKKTEIANEVLADPVAEKLRQQRLVEEADYKSTEELFAMRGDEKSLENFIPKSESDFLEYAELVYHKIRPFEKSYHYMGLVKNVMRFSMIPLKASDAKEIASWVSAIANEKLKAEKEANVKRKQGAKKKQLHVERADDDLVGGGGYDDLDDYDFM